MQESIKRLLKGPQLARTRKRALITGAELAKRMGVNATRVSHLEHATAVTPGAAERYRAALDGLVAERDAAR
jgi:transcriptional regulator with XRE-family HTH domain